MSVTTGTQLDSSIQFINFNHPYYAGEPLTIFSCIMQKILILFAHPAMHKSRINRALIQTAKSIRGVEVNDLYENYPDFFIDVRREQKLLQEHHIIIWHHPFYWYSAPALLKEWIDLVLEHNFAYGKSGTNLHGKWVMNCITTGGNSDVYSEEGRNHYTINQFLIPFHQTALLCGMHYLPPFVVHDTHNLNNSEIDRFARMYQQALTSLRDNKLKPEQLFSATQLNEIL